MSKVPSEMVTRRDTKEVGAVEKGCRSILQQVPASEPLYFERLEEWSLRSNQKHVALHDTFSETPRMMALEPLNVFALRSTSLSTTGLPLPRSASLG